MNNVRDLIEHLSKYPGDTPILQSRDAEGNGFSSVDDCSEMYVEADFTVGRVEDIWDAESLEDSADPGDEEEIYKDFKKVLVIWPV